MAAVGNSRAPGNYNFPPDGRENGPPESLSARVGVETGAAVVGPVGDGGQTGYRAVGAVVGAAAALQYAAKAGTVLVGPSTRSATEAERSELRRT